LANCHCIFHNTDVIHFSGNPVFLGQQSGDLAVQVVFECCQGIERGKLSNQIGSAELGDASGFAIYAHIWTKIPGIVKICYN
jgi:hypothetical protein